MVKGRSETTQKIKGILLEASKNRKGYLYINLWKENKGVKKRIHRLVALAFIDNPDNLPQVNHIDEIRINNSIDNLEWCTGQYNVEYSISKYYTFLDPNGEEISIYNLNKFCRENGLQVSNMCAVFSGKRKRCKGYTRK